MSPHLRIAQVANFVGPSSGGMRTAVHALGQRYVAAGARRLLVTPGHEDAVEETAAGTHVRLRAPQLGSGYRVILQPWRVIDALERFGPTSVEVSDKSTLLPVATWARRADVTSVLWSHERLDAMLSLRTGWQPGMGTGVAVLNRVLTRLFDRIVVTSRFAAAEFPPHAKPRLHRVPLGVDLDMFRPDVGTPSKGKVLRLAHAGRLSREKSPDLAVRTAIELQRRGVPVRLDVYGDGPMLPRLRRLDGDGVVTFHGHVSDRRALAVRLAAADIALSVCPGETFGLAILEALACGTPVVTADRGGGRELLTMASGAWAAPEPAALADAVIRLARRGQGSRVASRRRAEEFSWAATARAMLGIHRQVAMAPGSSDALAGGALTADGS